ncbi:MAG: hypothetical protein K0S55_362 [Clostridia bacterium]|nr:hypothetical protein [Clostridia bacterium]
MKKLDLDKFKMNDPKFKKLIKKYKKQYSKKYNDIHDKLTFREKRKTNPIVAIFGALAILCLIFCGLASFFFTFFSNYYGKKAENYMTLYNDKDKEKDKEKENNNE